MSIRDARFFVCNSCGKEKEAILVRKPLYGEIFYEMPTGWTLCDLSHNGHLCDDCTASIDTCTNVYDESDYRSCQNGFECSVCGEKVTDYEGYKVRGNWNYCPGCGRPVIKNNN